MFMFNKSMDALRQSASLVIYQIRSKRWLVASLSECVYVRVLIFQVISVCLLLLFLWGLFVGWFVVVVFLLIVQM